MRADRYQVALITLGLISTLLFGVFFLREIYPEYRLYQNRYIELEEFRSTYTHEPPPLFKEEIKQIVIEREDKGPATIDRCISCHVAVQFPHFSPTKIAYDINGKMMLDANGFPQLVPNEEYIWKKLDEKIAELKDSREADRLRNLKTVTVDGQTYDVTKVLAMHPLMGKETRPFEFHPLEEYGCTSCHSGNGRGLTTPKAHGPIFDEQYEIEFMGPKPQFIEVDKENDPSFARMFNDKPGSSLLFQTTPVLMGALVESKCMNCHQTSDEKLLRTLDQTKDTLQSQTKRIAALNQAFEEEILAFITLNRLKQLIEEQGLVSVASHLEEEVKNYRLSKDQLIAAQAQLNFLKPFVKPGSSNDQTKADDKKALKEIDHKLVAMLGSQKLLQQWQSQSKELSVLAVKSYLKQNKGQSEGSLFRTFEAVNLDQAISQHILDTSLPSFSVLQDQNTISAIQSDVDLLTSSYQRGKHLYFSQSCYACHRIAGLARGGVGPELTQIGNSYPWYIKESIVWPQADLKNSTMPNFHLDHQELEPLMTFLLSQTGQSKAVSSSAYRKLIQEWEAGRKTDIEKPLNSAQIYNLDYAMTVFATEGCAACHRLKGFESNVGYTIEKEQKDSNSFDRLYSERQWFTNLIPEEVSGRALVRAIEANAGEIDQRLSKDVRKDALLERINQQYPQTIESYYAPFRFALRAKDHFFDEQLKMAKTEEQKLALLAEKQRWKERVENVLMMYVQEYGLGRLIGPRPNWSGIYRSDEWLMEHFYKPTSHVARSIMPVMPFDATKFYALTYMLDVLGKRNRDQERAVWANKGFSPQRAYQIHCAQCHGEFLGGNGPVSEWIYPIPKNLRNAEFLRNYTKERVAFSITHGVKGTPMPPLGEVALDKPDPDGIPVLTQSEIRRLVDWLFNSLPGYDHSQSQEDIPKWDYSPEDVIEELKREGNSRFFEEKASPQTQKGAFKLNQALESPYLAALKPVANPKREDPKEDQIFEVVPNPTAGPDAYHYYIKKKYYTKQNIEQGRAFFELNCAVCHGSEGDGAGTRAGIMQDAKPRMLTNLDWLHVRDDLRMIRSIKYGVPGTSMTPWGDLTSSLQRLQLVIFIRSLSLDSQMQRDLATALYQAFDQPNQLIDRSKVDTSKEIAALKDQLQSLNQKQRQVQALIKEGKDTQQTAVSLYSEELKLTEKLAKAQLIEDHLSEIKRLNIAQSKLYADIGSALINRKVSDEVYAQYLDVIGSNAERFSIDNNKLLLTEDTPVQIVQEAFEKTLTQQIDQKVAELEQRALILKGQLSSKQRDEELAKLNADKQGFIQLKEKIISLLEEAKRLRLEQSLLYQKLKADKSSSGSQT